MSDTPTPRLLTDVERAMERTSRSRSFWKEKCEQLERELAEAKRIQDDLYSRCKFLQKSLQHEAGEVAELRKDKERLTFLIRERAYVFQEGNSFRLYWGDFGNGGERQYDTYSTPESAIDAAIDAARKEAGDV